MISNEIKKVFISYSHDNIEHKEWVLQLATRLRSHNVDSVLDQWDLKPGDDIPIFMEKNLSESHKTLMICTERYTDKANKGEGGVGYEKMILTSSLIQKIDENTIIPIIRQNGKHKVPTFLKTKLYIDFSLNEDYEFKFDELIRSIHNSAIREKPPVRNEPLDSELQIKNSHINDSLKKLMGVVVFLYERNPRATILHYEHLVKGLGTSRIFADAILKDALNLELLYSSADFPEYFELTEKGKHYAIQNKIIGKDPIY